MTDKTLRLGAYLLIVVLGIVGFWQIERANDRTDRIAKEAAYNLCIDINENRTALRSLIAFGRPIQPVPGADDWYVRQLEASNGRNAEFQRQVEQVLANEECPPNPFDETDKR